MEKLISVRHNEHSINLCCCELSWLPRRGLALCRRTLGVILHLQFMTRRLD